MVAERHAPAPSIVQTFFVKMKKSYKWADMADGICFAWKEHGAIRCLVEKAIPHNMLDGYGDNFAHFIRFTDNEIYKHLFDGVADDGSSPDDHNMRHVRGYLQD